MLITREIIIKLVKSSLLTDATLVPAEGWRGAQSQNAPASSKRSFIFDFVVREVFKKNVKNFPM